jgi:hypothetical protein
MVEIECSAEGLNKIRVTPAKYQACCVKWNFLTSKEKKQ